MTSIAAARPENSTLSPAAVSVLHTILYFDIFQHPLTTGEIHRNCQWQSCTLSETVAALEELVLRKLVDHAGDLWFLAGNNHLPELRSERQERAVFFNRRARQFASLVAAFPFVRAVCISGSLSKGTMDKKGDIDYFIITEPNRLWIARTLLVLFKKIFLLNSKKYFCVNYFIDTGHLAVPDRNLFVATEIVFLRPMNNAALFNDFLSANKWVNLFYPNREVQNYSTLPPARIGLLKKVLEKVFSGKRGEWTDKKLLSLTLQRWKKKFPQLDASHFEVDFRSRRHVSKHHPQGFQRKVAGELERRRESILERTGIHVPAQQWEWVAHSEIANEIPGETQQ